MANEEQVALLKQGVEVWNTWRMANPGILPNLSGANLNGAILTEAYLTEANLNGANLNGANLNGAILTEANLSRASLTRAHLNVADLFRANLRGAHLTGANLIRANLTRARLGEAHLNEADLRKADLTGANLTRAGLAQTIFVFTNFANVKGLETCRHSRLSSIDFQTLQQSGPLPLSFLRGIGLPDNLIDYLPSLLNQAIQFYSVFISYSHDDKSFAKRLYNELQGHGIRCWLDEHQLLPGDDIFDQIDHGIRLWDKILLCCSEASLKRNPWVDREIGKALQKEEALWKERGKKVLALIPLTGVSSPAGRCFSAAVD